MTRFPWALIGGLVLAASTAYAQNFAPTYRPLSATRLTELQHILDSLKLECGRQEKQLRDVRLLVAKAASATEVRRQMDSTVSDLRGRAQAIRSQSAVKVEARGKLLKLIGLDSTALQFLNDSVTSFSSIAPNDSASRDQLQRHLSRALGEASGRLSANRKTADELAQSVSLDSAQAEQLTSQASRLAPFLGADDPRDRLAIDTIAIVASVAGAQRAVVALESQMDEQRRLTKRIWLPVTNKSEARAFYGRSGVDLVSNVLFSGGLDGKAATAATEVGSGYIWRTRVSASLTVADAKQDSGAANRSAIERFLVGGGNLSITAISPLLFVKDLTQDNTLTVQLGSRMAADLNGAGGESQLGKPIVEVGLDVFGTVFTSAAPYYIRGACAGGGSPLVTSIATGRRQFCYAQITAGFEVPGLGRVVFSGAAGPKSLERPLALSIQPRIAR